MLSKKPESAKTVDSLVDQIAKADPTRHNSSFLAEVVLMGVGFVNLPAALILSVGVYAAEIASKHKSQSESPMPDDWLQQVSNTPNISKRGLSHLAKCLQRKGFVSVVDAMEWARIEEQEALKAVDQERRHTRLGSDGAKSLLLRAKDECPGILSVLDLDAAVKRVREHGQTATEFVSGLASKLKKKPD